MGDLIYRGHPIKFIGVGICLTLIEYRDLFTNLPYGQQPGNATSRQFRVPTIDLEKENNVCLLNDQNKPLL